MEAWLFLLRWFHFLAGITWIGMLYYFNFVQVPFFAGAEAPVRTGMITGGLVARALWWFRWGAMITFITGWLYLLHKLGQFGLQPFFSTSYGWAIFMGGIIGSLMWFNVWFIIWPAQQVVMASATRVKEGGQAIPEAAAQSLPIHGLGARAGAAEAAAEFDALLAAILPGVAPVEGSTADGTAEEGTEEAEEQEGSGAIDLELDVDVSLDEVGAGSVGAAVDRAGWAG